jgi:hypothetical protein
LDTTELVALLALFIPCFVTLIIIMWVRNTKRKASRIPFREPLRRPAGEALRLKLLELDDKINDYAVWLLSIPAFTGCVHSVQHATGRKWFIVAFVTCSGFSCFIGFRVYRLITERANYRLGYDGERYVAEELSRLIAFGFHIYHDVPFETPDKTNFNIDHVLVGPGGVFAIETKTRSKPLDESAKEQYKVYFDGKQLQWPRWNENQSIDQATRNATTLGEWLRQSTGASLWATAIVVIPGWKVERLVPCEDVHILKLEELYNFCACQPKNLTAACIKSCCDHLDDKCGIEIK